MIENDKLIIMDEWTIKELLTFVAGTQNFEAQEGFNDDLCMTLVLFGWLVQQQYFKDEINTDVRALLHEEKIVQEERDRLSFGFIDDGLDYVDDVEVDKYGNVWQNYDPSYSSF